MTPLNLPTYPFKLTQKRDKLYIFDEVRKKHLVLTPEEWVRQHFIQYLINQKNFPSSLIQIEGGLILNQQQKRSDILVFNNQAEKILLVECKAPTVKISQDTFDQAARYNSIYQAPWIVVTNGLEHYFAHINFLENQFTFVPELPDYNTLK